MKISATIKSKRMPNIETFIGNYKDYNEATVAVSLFVKQQNPKYEVYGDDNGIYYGFDFGRNEGEVILKRID